MLLTFALTHGRLVGYAIACLALLAFVGWIGHLVDQHKRDQVHIAAVEQQLSTAVQTNQENLAQFERYKADEEKAQAALAAEAERATARAATVASIHQEIAHVTPKPGPAPAGGPYIAAALARLRQLHAAAGDHQAAGGTPADPAAAAAVPAGPRHP